MALEAEGRWDDAAAAFASAWHACEDDFDACIAAHFLAQTQRDDGEALHWNRIALERAHAVGDGRVREFLASLWLNLGRSHEALAQVRDAVACYERALAALADVPEGPYRDVLRTGIGAARARLRASGGNAASGTSARPAV
jgi:tetratricopeptide (TPR) repeat protein